MEMKYHYSPTPNYICYEPCIPYYSIGVIGLNNFVCSIKYGNILAFAPECFTFSAV